MATTLKIVAGNTAPSWVITCDRNGIPIGLAGCTVSLIIAKGNTVTNSFASATILNASAGIISYTPVAGDCPTAGTYKIDVKVVYSDLTFEILYEQLKVKARSPIIAA